MYTLLLLISLSMLCSCASNNYYPAAYLKKKAVLVTDEPNQTVYFTSVMDDVKLNYDKWVSEGRINKNIEHSCFDDSKSVNYIMINVDTISHLRLYSTGARFDVNHKTVNTVQNGQYSTISQEKLQDNLKVKQQVCNRVVNNVHQMVVSELYN